MKGFAQMRPFRRARQHGASAVEFVLLFPIMFAIAYGSVVYAYIYILQQAINFAAQQGAQAAVGVVPVTSPTTTQQNRLTLATSVAQSTLNWVPTGRLSYAAGAGGCTAPSGTFTFQVNFTPGGLFPMVTLPLMGSFPPVPAAMYACAVAYT